MQAHSIPASHFGKDIREFLACLNRHAVECLLVGGEAVIFYGYPRVTGDIDIFYRLTPDNARRLYDALCDFWGGRVPGIRASSGLRKEGVIVQFGVAPNRIDLVNRIDGIEFDEALDTAVTITLQGADPPLALRMIGLEALIRNKKAAGRPKDLDDVRFLEAALVRHRARRTRRTKK